jgi:hypothetical protein
MPSERRLELLWSQVAERARRKKRTEDRALLCLSTSVEKCNVLQALLVLSNTPRSLNQVCRELQKYTTASVITRIQRHQ